MSETRRLTEILKSYWSDLKGDRAFPDEQLVHPEDLGEVWPRCFLIHVSDKKDTFTYDFLGDELVEAYDYGIYEGNADKVIDLSNERMRAQLFEVLKTKKPAFSEVEFLNEHDVEVRCREIMLPLGPDDETVTFILGGVGWKGY
jgi:hypothetical protein